MLKKDIDYDVVGFRRYRIIKSFKVETGIIPPDGDPIKTKFGYFSSTGKLSIYRGFVWDGATGAYDTPDFMRGSCVHDWFCNAVDNGDLPVNYRRKGDDLLKEIIIQDGMPLIRANYVHAAVVKWGQVKYHDKLDGGCALEGEERTHP